MPGGSLNLSSTNLPTPWSPRESSPSGKKIPTVVPGIFFKPYTTSLLHQTMSSRITEGFYMSKVYQHSVIRPNIKQLKIAIVAMGCCLGSQRQAVPHQNKVRTGLYRVSAYSRLLHFARFHHARLVAIETIIILHSNLEVES